MASRVSRISLLLVGTMTACGGAVPDASHSDGIIFENGLQLNDAQLNGLQLNGLQLNGLQLNGLQLNGLQLNGLQLNGLQLNGLQLNGSTLSAYQNGDPNQLVSGLGFVGATFDIALLSGGSSETVSAQINAIYLDPQNPTGDVYLYNLSYQPAGSSTWTSVCKDASGSAVPGIFIANSWNMTTGARIDDASTMTFACVNAALGKCVHWGYRPWASATRCAGSSCSTVSLRDYHQACTRMVRADYCGNGQPHTVEGTPIDIFDNLSPGVQSRATNWKLEARWTPSGATCVGNTRQEDLFKKSKYPDCNGNHDDDDIPKCADEHDYSLQSPNLLGNNYNG